MEYIQADIILSSSLPTHDLKPQWWLVSFQNYVGVAPDLSDIYSCKQGGQKKTGITWNLTI